MKKTGLLFFPAFDWALSETHPEREERLLYTQEQLLEEGIMDLPQIRQYQPGMAAVNDILLTQGVLPHPNEHDLDPHRIAAGSALVLGQAWATGQIANGFALVRPPGHHSGATVWDNRGFCTLNNEAILVNFLRSQYGYKKIAIVDTDVHHGDGTQDIFYHDPNILFISVHQDGRTLFPGTGFTREKGGPNAWDSVLNIPLPPGVGDDGYHYILENWVLPRLEKFNPEVIINSAGQDNHFSDPLASMNVTAQGYAKITDLLKPDLAVLEGGYSIEGALPYVNMAIILALAGLDYRYVRESVKPTRPQLNFSTFKHYCEELKSLNVQARPSWLMKDAPFLPTGKWYHVPRSIYYDTTGFQEICYDWIRQCSHCGGVVLLDSQHAGTHQRAAVIRIPFEACSVCVQTGYDLFETLAGHRDSVLLQDQPSGRSKIWHLDKGVEEY